MLGLWYELPGDGLPHLQAWTEAAANIYQTGFEGHRETMEVRLRPDYDEFKFAKVVPIKGVGRASVLLFGLVYTFLEWRDDLLEDELEDFKR